MKKTLLLFTFFFSTLAMSADNQTLDATVIENLSPNTLTPAAMTAKQGSPTYTYVRCWYRPDYTHDDPSTDWEWAKQPNGDYFTVQGYWYSSVSLKNMFFTTTPQTDIAERCQDTLGVTHDTADITYFASDTRFSYNHSIWTQDTISPSTAINKIISFGDSISDTGNLFNGSQWIFPNSNSWFLGHFSNGFVWTEYLAKAKQLPLYTWAVGGAAGDTQYVVLSGIHDQVNSYLTYMKYTKNYQPKSSLFTIEFGLNDFVNYDRSVADVSEDFRRALQRLTSNGAENILVLNLPDATKAPQFKYSDPQEAVIVKQKIEAFNQFVATQVAMYKQQGINIALYDTFALFDAMTSNPEQYGFRNASDACLNINRSSSKDYLMSHALTNDCATYGSDSYVFWGVTHPTTQTHKVIAEQILKGTLDTFSFQ